MINHCGRKNGQRPCPEYRWRGLQIVTVLSLLAGCASAPPIQPAASSKSQFDGAVYSGKTVSLDKPTPGEESYRAFQRGATGFVSLQSVRSSVEESATGHCDRKGKVVRALAETDAKPPYILGNFPRVELVFECVSKPSIASIAGPNDKYERLAELKKLVDNGTLTQVEFEQEKAKILAQP